jgi:opacity protein-like surface antigen
MNIIIVFLTFLILLPFTSQADNRFYIEPKFGIAKFNASLFHSNPNNSFIGEVEGGYLINKHLSIAVNASLAPSIKYSSNHDSYNPTLNTFYSHYTHLKMQSLLFNSYYNFPNSKFFMEPYIGIGAGISKNTIKDTMVYQDDMMSNVTNYYYLTREGASNTNLAWNLILGGIIKLNNNFKLDVQYKYTNLGKIKTGNYIIYRDGNSENAEVTSSNLTMQSIVIGLRYEF